MSSFAGIRSAIADVDRATESVSRLGRALEEAAPALQETTGGMRALGAAAASVKSAVEDLAGAGGETGRGTTAESRGLAQLRDLEGRIRRVFGEDNFFAETIQRRIREVEAGNQTIAEAIQFLREFFGAYAGGLSEEMLSRDPAIRALALELEMFIHSGMLS